MDKNKVCFYVCAAKWPECVLRSGNQECWAELVKLAFIDIYLEDPGIDGKILLSWIFRKWDVGVWTGSSWLRIGTGGGHL